MGILRLLVILALITVSPPAPGTRWEKRFLFLVDVSGSMAGEKSTRAVKGFLEIAQQPVDEMQMNVWIFDDKVKEWPQKWVKLPAVKALDDAAAYLDSQNKWAGTQILPALKRVLTQKGQFNLVIIGDGQYLQETTKGLLAALKPLKARKIVISFVSIGPVTEQTKAMGKFCGGGVFQIGHQGRRNRTIR